MTELKINSLNELQGYFVKRIGKFLNSKGKILIGWDENLDGGGLTVNDICMVWSND